MKNILITGGAGFIGSHIADYFASQNISNNIIIVDNYARSLFFKEISKKQMQNNLSFLQKNNKIRFYDNDIKDTNFLKKLFQKFDFDIICHTSGQTAVSYSIDNPYIDYENNLFATINLLETIRKSKSNPKLIYFSSNKVFGDNVNNLSILEKEIRYEFQDPEFKGIPEKFPVDNCHHSPYGISKLCSDLYIQEYGYTYGLDFIILRMSCIYGPHQLAIEAQGWINHLILNAIEDKTINVYGNGKQLRDVLFISDLIKIFKPLTESKIKNEVYCIGGGKENTISILELIQLLEKLLEKKIRYNFHDWRKADQKIYFSDITKASQDFNWSPGISPEGGIKKIIKYYRKR
ncbi:MAG: NAD-dependent epimerase/dehydratase family protein [Promethearchaeota archaeon]|nr:MAG: NAD-dependent epimerase/dehydratase family protein [Candidatus Lokiarchaeota archaeon]